MKNYTYGIVETWNHKWMVCYNGCGSLSQWAIYDNKEDAYKHAVAMNCGKIENTFVKPY